MLSSTSDRRAVDLRFRSNPAPLVVRTLLHRGGNRCGFLQLGPEGHAGGGLKQPQERQLISSSLLLRLTLVSRAVQRVLLVALCLIPLILVTVASLPALAILPFTSAGSQRASGVLRDLAGWAQKTLVSSRR